MKGSLSLEKLAHGHFVQRKSTKEGTARPQTSNDVDDDGDDDDEDNDAEEKEKVDVDVEEEVDNDDKEEGDENFAVLTNAPLYTKENHQKRDHCRPSPTGAADQKGKSANSDPRELSLPSLLYVVI